MLLCTYTHPQAWPAELSEPTLRLLKSHSNLKCPSPLLHEVHWDWKPPFQEPLSETPPLPGTWPWPPHGQVPGIPTLYVCPTLWQWPALNDTEQTSKKEGKGVNLCCCRAVGSATPRGRAEWYVRAEGKGWNPRVLLGNSFLFLNLIFSPWKSGQW